MLLSEVLAAAFEDEVVVLAPDHPSLLLLDAWAARVWRSCDGSSTEAIVASMDGPAARVHETLEALTDAGLIRRAGKGWTSGPVEWV
jgi:hypothetical protein